jgi:flagellar biosynthesis GTPase FlhF
VSRDFDFNFEFDKGMIGGLIMLVIFPPVGILMLVNRFRKFGRGKNKYRQIRNMGITTIVASLFYAFFELPGWSLLAFLSGLGLTVLGQKDKNREERFRRYLAVIGGRSPIALSEIAARANERIDTVEKDLQTMIDMGYFGLDTYIDHNRHCIVLDGVDDANWSKAYEAASQTAGKAGESGSIHINVEDFVKTAADIFHTVHDEVKKEIQKDTAESRRRSSASRAEKQEAPKAQARPQPEKAQEQPAKPAQEDQFGRILSQIRELNNRIADKEISAKIDQIETITAKIFGIVRKKPERIGEIRKFMNYYLPTTLKLLDSYAMLEEQGIEGDNITASKKQISQIMDTLIKSFEKQLDQLFSTQAMDISSDIEVMENMLAADGLKDSDFKLQRRGGH